MDARFLTHPQEGGFKTYTESIVHGLAMSDRQNEYVLYTDGAWPSAPQLGENFQVKPVGGSGPVREQVTLPMAMARDHVDVAHFLCNTAALTHRFPTVLTIHDIIPCLPYRKIQPRPSLRSRALARYWRTVMPRAARRASHVITISESSKNDIRNVLEVPEERITVVPTGLHPAFRPARDPQQIRRVGESCCLPDRYILGFVSSDPRKNSARLIEAASMLEARAPDIWLVLICSSPEARTMALDTAALKGRPTPRLRLLDPIPREDLAVVYSLAEALAFPSLYEGFGLPVVEAMACATAVVTSNVSSLPEVAGDAAILVDPTDARSIADALFLIVTDRRLRLELIKRGFARAARFGWRRTASETIAVYERVWREATRHPGLGSTESRLAGGVTR